MISTPSDPNATAAVAVIPIDDPTLQTTNQEQENEDLDDQLLAEMGVSSSQAVQVTEVTQVDLMSGIQAAHDGTDLSAQYLELDEPATSTVRISAVMIKN